MELKLGYRLIFRDNMHLLIVPYGIETILSQLILNIFCLLIVPYGIETSISGYSSCFCFLLIVPYGIETLKHQL